MAKERLLKRIRNWSVNESAAYFVHDLDGFTQSVMDDLSKLYNTRRGTVIIDPKFGVPDYTSMMSNMNPTEIEKLMRAFILVTNQYEKRLKNLSIRQEFREEDKGLIRFKANCKINFNEQLYALIFDILLQGDGSVALQIQD